MHKPVYLFVLVPSLDKWGGLRQEGHLMQNFCHIKIWPTIQISIPDRSKPELTMAESNKSKGQRVVIGADFSRYVGDRNSGD